MGPRFTHHNVHARPWRIADILLDAFDVGFRGKAHIEVKGIYVRLILAWFGYLLAYFPIQGARLQFAAGAE